MSLLTKHFPETVTVFMEEVVTDADGNIKTRPSTVGVTTPARIQVSAQSGTSNRRAEQDTEGFMSETMYSMRLPNDFPIVGAQAQVVWEGKRYAVFGDPEYYNGSARTRRVSYKLRRY